MIVKGYKANIPFILLFIVFAMFYYDSVLDKGPLNVHLWRQADCLSMTENYADGASFFAPEMHIQLGDKDSSGYSAGEFPVLYYLVGKAWSVFGKSHLTYRLFYLIILFAGVFAFYRSLLLVLKDNFWATLLALLLFTSPVLAYYGVSFLTDGPAFSFILIAIYFMVRYHQKVALRYFWLAMLFFALAGLIKVSSLIAFVVFGGILLLETLSINTLGKKKLYHGWKMEWLGFFLVLAAMFSWYYYASKFNDEHNFRYTFNNIWPLWYMDDAGMIKWVEGIKNFTSHIFYSRPMWLLLTGSIVANLLLWKRVPLLLWLGSLGVALGVISYIILWGPLLENHDYYFVALLILFVGCLSPLVWYLRTRFVEGMQHRIVRIMATGFLLFNFLYCWQVMQLRTNEKDRDKAFVFIGNQTFVHLLAGINKHEHENGNYRFERMEPYLLELGVQESDLVISLPDPSFNVSLYLMGRKGWTNFNNYAQSEDFDYLKEKGAKYLIVSDSNYLKNDFLQPHLNQIGEFEGISIHKLD